MTAKERLKKFVEYKNMGRNKFEESVGISLGYISSKSPSVGSEIIEKILKSYPELNVEWLVNGLGSMVKSDERTNWNSLTSISPDMRIMQVPLVSQYAQSVYISRSDDSEYIKSLPTIPIIADYESKGNYMCFEVRGDSMNDGSDNSYKSGDILICREVDLMYLGLTFTKWKSFVIIHKKEGIVVKQIIECNSDSTIKIHSLNPLYDDKILQISDIEKLFYVVKILRDENR